MAGLRDFIARALYITAAAFLILSVVIMTMQIVLRVIFNYPLIWPEEVSRYLFVWVVYLGTVVGVINDTHIRVLVAIDPLGRKGRFASDALSRIVNFICFAFLLYWGIDLAEKYKFAEFYTLPGWPQLWFYYLALPLSAAMCMVFCLLPSAAPPDHTPPGETAL